MRYAVITDIHANLEALGAVFSKIGTLKPDRILCLGDIVGYNADPFPCVKQIRDLGPVIVRGNHDKAAAGLMSVRQFNTHAAQAVRWTERALADGEMNYIRNLLPGPLPAGEGILLCHGSPQDEDLYLASGEAVRESFDFLSRSSPDVRVCFFGHTHVPFAIDDRGQMQKTTGSFTLERNRVYLINPGSVGQPRDGNPKAGFGLFDDDQRVWSFFRVPYAYKETQLKIMKAGLPPVLAERLSLGR